ncbi:MAG: AAA family ATPase [Anaerolineae bacterium]
MGGAAAEATRTQYANSLEQFLAGLTCVDLRVRQAIARAQANGLNPNDEFRGLYISEGQVKTLLAYELGQHFWSAPNGANGNGHANGAPEPGAEAPAGWDSWSAAVQEARDQWQARTRASREAGVTMLFDQLVRAFALTEAEVDVLLITLAPEIDLRYERLFAYLQDDVTRKRPSIDLILNLLADSFAHKLELRRLFTNNGTLMGSRLLRTFTDGGGREPMRLAHFVRPAPHLVEHLLGIAGLDERLAGCGQLFSDEPVLLRRLAPELAQQILAANEAAGDHPPFFTFVGGYGVGKQEAARHLAAAAGRPLISMDMAALGSSETGLDEGLALLLRDGRMLQAVLYLTQWDSVLQDGRLPARLLRPLLAYPHTLIAAGDNVWRPGDSLSGRRAVFTIQFELPDYDGRLRYWQTFLQDHDSVEVLDLAPVANHFRFSPGQIEDAIATAHDLARWRNELLTTADLFAASRAHSNQNLATLATKIQPRYGWEDIILPQDTLDQLAEMVNTVRQRPVVYGDWGFGRKLALGKGLNALFAGESGTGKTMAADIMAGALGLDLYKVDLSTLVSKYIGETEKNLDRIFTEAATSNAILFFDEADAIFGKRSEVKDSHDRYANIEISYLLQRMEAYDGVVILATNLRANLDEAFTRRLHFAIEFPFPEAADRRRIWRVNFPPETPIAPDVDFGLLARRFRLTGGNIRNIILAAAFLAAESEQPVGMRHLLHATRREYQKMGRLIDESLFAFDGGENDI